MPYYDFSSQRSKQKKSLRLLAPGLAITAAIIAALLTHHHEPTLVTSTKTKPTRLTLQSKSVNLLPETHPVKTIEKVSANAATPPLEFYEMLKSSNNSAHR
jgi:hypothetical protein